MPSLKVPESGLSLEGPLGSSKTAGPQSSGFCLNLADSVIEEMIKCVRTGKAIQLSLGTEPKILYGSKTQHLALVSDPFTHELYRTDLSTKLINSQSTSLTDSTGSMMNRVAPPTHQIRYFANLKRATTIQKPAAKKAGAPVGSAAIGKAVAGTSASKFPDEALAQLENSMALAKAQKLENTTTHVKDSSSLPPAVQQRGPALPLKASNKNRFLNNKSLASGTTRSMPTSPALSGMNSPALAPTSVPLSQQQAEKAKVVRKPIIHELARGPATKASLLKFKNSETTNDEFNAAINKVADLKDGKYTLLHKWYRDLDVYNYNYATEEDRDRAVTNAIRVYDKLRLNSSEPEWDRLLPENERGTGKWLSQVQAKIAVNSVPKAPKISVHRAEDSGRDTGAEDNGDLVGEKSTTSTLKSESMVRSHSQPPTSKPKRVSEKEAQAKRLLAKPGSSAKTAMTKSQKISPEKTSSKIKSAKFVSDSDEEDDYLTSTAKPTNTIAPKKRQPPANAPSKRPRDDVEAADAHTPAMKKPKTHERTASSSTVIVNSGSVSKHRVSDASQSSRSTTSSHTKPTTSPQKSSPLASSPPTNANELSSSPTSSSTSPYAHPSLKRKTAPTGDANVPYGKRHYKSTSISTTSSTTSTSSVALWDNEPTQAIKELAAKFNVYYQAYKRLYHELERDESRRRKEMGDLLDMQQRLDKMKKEILVKSGV